MKGAMTEDSNGYAKWLEKNPAPDLQELVRRHGGYNRITPQAWREWDAAQAAWEEKRRNRHKEP
jgi:hypothetical protein